MKKFIFCAGLFFWLCLLVPFQANAQQTFGFSVVGYDDTTNTVYGSSTTVVDYIGAFHYTAYVEGYLYDQAGNLLDSGYDENYFIAEVLTIAPAFPVTQYTLYSDHYLVARFFTTVVIRDCDPYCYYCFDYFADPYCSYYCYSCYGDYWWDPFGFSYGYPGYYGPWWYFYGYGPPANLETEYIYLGSTSDSLITPLPSPPQCGNLTVNIGSFYGSDAGSNLSTQTRHVLLGSSVRLAADIVPETPGSFRWSIAGTHQDSPSGAGNNTNDIRWTEEGIHRVTVTFVKSDGSCQASSSFNVNAIVPTLGSYTVRQNIEQALINGNCSRLTGDTFSLGCFPSPLGILFDATAEAPTDSISVPADSHIKFVQIVSQYRRRYTVPYGTQCVTTRTGGFNDSVTGWALDGADPYDDRPDRLGVANFTNTYIATIATSDSPANPLNSPLQYQSLDVNDQFEMYVIYFSGDPHLPDLTRVIGKVSWYWGGNVAFVPDASNYSVNPFHPFNTIFSGSPASDPMRPYTGLAKVMETDWAPCPESNPPACDPGGTAAAACRRRGYRYEWDPESCTCNYVGMY
jgi:hypothetical protein